MRELLDGVSDVDWASLGHAYGSAEQVPVWLAGLLDPMTSAKALDDLDTSIYHQGGGAYTAAAAALPFLIRLPAHPGVPGRADILDLLGQFARLQNTMVEPWKSKPEALACRAVLYGAFDVFRGLLDDDDPAIQARAAELLVEFVDRADEVVDEFRLRYPAAANEALRVEVVWAVGRLSSALSAAHRPTVRAWLQALTPPLGDPVRLAFLVARRRIDPTAVPYQDLLAAVEGALYPAQESNAITWMEKELAEERPARLILARRAIDDAMRTGRSRGMASAGAVMIKWRSASADMIPIIAATLHDLPDIAESALHLLAAAGEVSRPYLEDIAAKVGEPGRTGALAAWALARLGDERALPMAVRSLRGQPDIYPIGGSQYTDRFYWLTQDPGIAEVLTPLTAFADRIVPALRQRLQRDDKPPVAHQFGDVVIAYGAAAAGAVPEFTAMLGTDRHRTACRVLAALGPAATAARDRLVQCAAGEGFDASQAAWALFRVTGDPQPFLDTTDVWGGRFDIMTAARSLADFGPLAIRFRDRIELLLHERQSGRADWTTVELAHAHFRITGEPVLCTDAFDKALDLLRRKQQPPVTRQVLRYLPELGPATVRFEPLLRQVIEQDERLIYSGGWRAIAEDDEARALAAAALSAMAH
ncbi:hypothetical protein HDA40_007971 [Hamadaea flava]|uniref:HEAT repeat domain-containing protein n=1 Tax=Hamadaea flava TaxID=1742688 RepID=A0ABV8LDU5_9ACTN|nr:hypothetical protein [Hamadaea flava]MCP2329464.1 hypothetical protein [Hamadaea flava]